MERTNTSFQLSFPARTDGLKPVLVVKQTDGKTA